MTESADGDQRAETEFEGWPELTDAVLVAAFEGWNDAGDAATGSIEHLELVWDSQPLMAIDPDEYYDFQVNRPTVSMVDGVTRRVSWPTTRLSVCRPPGAAFDLVLVRGIEPNMRWRAFCDELLDVIRALDVRVVVTLGALLSDTPHTRPTSVTGTSYDQASAVKYGLEKSRYEGPTGIVGVLQDACVAAGIPAISFWAGVPHYVSQPPNPKATIALLHSVEEVLDVPVPLAELPQQADEWQKLVDEMAAEDDEVTEYIRNLEQRDDEIDRGEMGATSGDAIAREFERYLRRRDRGHGFGSGSGHGPTVG
ncbi:MAG TPA: PAC2 family protein [Jatrophihabitantaceae bacterium]|nr:PAC2 family protein [Jatrophihabitantaceae bacterium]